MPGACSALLDQRVDSMRSNALPAAPLLGLAKPFQPVVGSSPDPEPATNPTPRPAAMPAASVVWAGSAIGAGQDSMSMTTWPEPLREIQKTLPGVKPSALSSATWYLFCSAPAANAVQFTPRLAAADVP